MSIFESLKRASHRTLTEGPAGPLFFQLLFDRRGAYLQVVDAQGKVVEDIDPRPYHGAEHDVLKLVAAFQDQNLFSIAWDETTSDRLYLAEHEMLLWPLRRCTQFVDKDLQPLRFAEGTAELIVAIKEAEGPADAPPFLKSQLQLRHEGTVHAAPRAVTERYWLVNDTLYETLPTGPNATLLPGFATTLPVEALPRLLSLLFSYIQHVQVKYGDYRLREGPPLETRPTLFIEQVDASQALYLRVSASVPGWPPEWFQDYDLSTLVEVDDEARMLRQRAIVYGPVGTAQNDLRKRLRATKRGLRDAAVFFEEDTLIVMEQAMAQAFLREHLPDLLRSYILYGADKLKAYQIRSVSPALNLRLDHGIDFLEGDASLSVEDETLSLFEALTQYRKHGYLQLSDGTRALVDPTYFDRLERLFKKKKDGVEISFFDLPLVEELIDEKTASTLPPARDVFRGFNTLHERPVPTPDVKATLRPYQQYGYRWLHYLHEHRLGGCLADDMGLGKTIQTIAMLAAVYAEPPSEAPSLVVMPRSLLFNWANELNRFAPHLTHHTYHGPDRDLEAALQAQVILTTYDIVRIDIEALREHRFYYAVLDEAQRIKNTGAQTSKAAMLLDAAHRLALSGTPIENNLGELYALFRFLNPAMFGSAKQFARDYGKPIQKDGNTQIAHELRRKIYPFVLRRLKRDVAKDLPERIDQTLYVDMTPEQAQFYEQQRRFYRDAVNERVALDGVRRAQFFILQALGELRQIATIPEALTEGQIRSPKRDVFLEQITELAANGRKALVFANYLAAVEAIGQDLNEAGLGYVQMTGATRHRQPLVQQFQEDPDTHVFLMTLKTGSLGLNLTAADTVFLFDPWWNQAAEQQAIDRTHRIGQDKTVFSYRLIARGTIEEKILQLQEQKRALFDQIIAADGASLKHLDEEDISFIFS